MMIQLNDTLERSEWLACLQAAAAVQAAIPNNTNATKIAEFADQLFEEYRKRCRS